MNRATSSDGTHIAFERFGSGPAVILVGGATCDRAMTRPLAEELARNFTVINFDRRGRGDIGRGGTIPTDLLGAVNAPTLVLCGGASPAWMTYVGRQADLGRPAERKSRHPGWPGTRRTPRNTRAGGGGVLRRPKLGVTGKNRKGSFDG